MQYKPQLQSIQLKLTTDCNGRCSYCYMHHTKEYMDPALLERIFKVAPVRFILLHGGEPTLYPVEIVKKYANPFIQFIMTSNGSNVAAIEKYFPLVQRVAISLDPPFSKRWVNNTFTYTDIFNNVKYLHNKGYNVTVLAIITRNWIEHLDEVCDFITTIRKMGIRIGVERCVGDDSPTNADLRLIHDTLIKRGITPPDKLRRNFAMRWACGNCHFTVVIDVKGRCYLCGKKPGWPSYVKPRLTPLGLIETHNQLIQEAESIVPKCKFKCAFRNICSHGCYHFRDDKSGYCAMGVKVEENNEEVQVCTTSTQG